MISVSDYIARFIASLGVKHVFLVAGGGNLPLIESISARSDLTYICTHHEQAAAMAAEAYSRVSENIGVCIVTFGPGATNTLTGVAGAWLDSIPVLYISGQVKTDHMATYGLRQLGVQEVDIIEMVKPITKYAKVVNKATDIRYHLEAAVWYATHERPGPVFLDIPLDVLNTTIEERDLTRAFIGAPRFFFSSNDHQAAQTIQMISESKRPVIFAGHGIKMAKGRGVFEALVQRLKVPVLTTMSAHDLIPTDHPLAIGRPGVFGDRAGNFAIQNADLILSIGARHHLWDIGYNYRAFAPKAKKIVVDIDGAELAKKTVVPDLAIQADARAFMNEMMRQTDDVLLNDFKPWIERCQRWKRDYPVVLPEYKDQKTYVNSYHFTSVLAPALADNEIIFTGVGTSFTGTLQCINLKRDQRIHSNVGCAAMGYDLPAAIGACFAANRQRIVLITGDGSIMMNLQELQTIVHHRLPIKIFLLNNGGYLAIKNSQNAFFSGKLEAVDYRSGVSFPRFSEVAATFGIPHIHVYDHSDVLEKIYWTLDMDGPRICELHMSPTQPLIPKVYAEKRPDGTLESRPLEDMAPLLDRDEFNLNMSVSQ